ncbi:MAG: SurA N-terminal domain-containing protein [Alphaproteobacteria bacterium]|nr:SurA N-terminal domain-containing protein [Alphaproteobacteria bacterium]MCL2890188.1 SurA N-terminal domain-containing protein [Alphaproteobacteria bacterium]
MLEYFRNASDKPVTKILMGVLIFSFVGWGVAEWVLGGGSTDDAIIRVGGRPVTMQHFEQERGRQLSMMDRAQQRQLYADRQLQIAFSQQILQQLSSQMMLDARAYDLGFTVTNAAVAAAIRSEPAFMENGRFSPAKFDSVLFANGLTETGFAAHLRGQILRDMVVSSVASAPTVPDFMVTAMHIARGRARDIEFQTIKFADFKAPTNPTDDNLRETYAKNPKTIPEFRTVSYVLVTAKMEQPDEHDRAYVAAQRLEDSLIGGETMAAAAKRHNAKHVALAPINAARAHKDGKTTTDAFIDNSVIAVIFALDEGMESEIIETKSGFAILRVEKIAPAHIADMESMRKELVTEWQRDEQRKQAYLRANEILVAANTAGKSIGKPVRVTRASGAPLEVLYAAFANPVGAKTIIQGRDAFYVLYVKTSIAPPKLDDKKRAELTKDAATSLGRVMLDDYSAFLSRKYPVKINNKLFRRLFGE